jgi:cytochrome P450
MSQEIISLADVTPFQTRSEEFFPLAWYEQMLKHGPYYHEGTDTWHVFAYDHVKQVLANYEFFTSEGTRTTIAVGAKSISMPKRVKLTSIDPPNHRKSRSLFSAAFTPRSLKDWEPRIQQIAEELVADIQENETTDIVKALASPLPSLVIADLFGVPLHDRNQFKHWVDVLFLPYVKGMEDEIETKKQAAAKEYFEYLYPIVVQKRQNPTDDIISDLIQVEVDGEKFTDEEIVLSTMMLLGAGVETTGHMLANTFYSLLHDDPTLYQQLRNDVSLAPKVTEEMLRYRFHISKRDRTVKQDNDLLGVKMKKGDVVVAWMSAANMDEQMFADPFTLNIHRPNNKKHLTFGNGPHFCLGAPLARLEINIALTVFAKQFTRIEPVAFDLETNLTNAATGQTLKYLPLKAYKK